MLNGWSLSCITFFFSEFDCECIKWDQCSWSNDAFIRAKGLSRESEEYEQIKEKIRKHTCGESSQHMVYCCSSNQGSPDEIKALETGMYSVTLQVYMIELRWNYSLSLYLYYISL